MGIAGTQDYIWREQLLGLEVTDHCVLDGVSDNFAPYYRLWNAVIEFLRKEQEWMGNPISTLKATEIVVLLVQWYRDVHK